MTKLGKYEIIEEIGRGGFATVYRARDTRMSREVALKVIAGSFAQEPAFIERFQQEARTAANLRHPNIVPVYDFGDADGTLYLAMALIGEGRTLRDLLAEQAPLSLERALPILTQLADALDYLHGRSPPLTHRDVKPANVLLEGEGNNLWVILTDFGLVRSIEASTELTKSGTILGTPTHMAPEQADPKKWGTITPLTDVYALGVVAYEMLTGRVPFEGEALTVLHAHAYEVPLSPLEFIPDLGDDLSTALLRALAKPPVERYPGAMALVVGLQRIVAERRRQVTERVELAHLLEQVQAARQANDWLSVQRLCVQIMQLDRANPDALTLMAEATRGLQEESAREVERRRLARLYEEGEQALADRQWQAAAKAFAAVFEGNPDFREVRAKLAQARDELQCAQWYDEAIAHGEAGHWAEACRIWVKLLDGRLGYRDGDAAFRLLDVTKGLLSQYDTMEKRLNRELVRRREQAKLIKASESAQVQRIAQDLEVLFNAIPEIEELAVISIDGLFLVALLSETEGDRVSALSAALLSLSERVAAEFMRGLWHESYLLADQGCMILTELNEEFVLMVLLPGWIDPIRMLDVINHEIENWSIRSDL